MDRGLPTESKWRVCGSRRDTGLKLKTAYCLRVLKFISWAKAAGWRPKTLKERRRTLEQFCSSLTILQSEISNEQTLFALSKNHTGLTQLELVFAVPWYSFLTIAVMPTKAVIG